ncbi:MAG: hypothetical protein WAW96_17230, partial [Alphaproteobacteria bacterium]
LLPEEKKVLGKRGTNDAQAYELFLLSRQYSIKQGKRYAQVAVNLLKKAVERDPNYADAWARLAGAQQAVQGDGIDMGDPQVSLKRALEIDTNCASARATNAKFLANAGRFDEALREIGIALALDPDSFEVAQRAAGIFMVTHRYADAIEAFEKVVSLAETDFASFSLIAQCENELGNPERAKSAARRGIARAEAEIARDPANGEALAHGASLWAFIGDASKCKEWAARTMLVDPDNANSRYNLACCLIKIGEIDAGLDHLEAYFNTSRQPDMLIWANEDSDLDSVREDPRYKKLMAAAEARLATKPAADEPTAKHG